MDELRQCNRCDEIKSTSEFYRHSARYPLRRDCKTCQREANDRWRSVNREADLAKKRKRYRERREELLEQQRLYYEKNKGSVKAYQRRYAKENPDKVNALARKYRKANPEAGAVKTRNRRALKRSAPGHHKLSDTRAIFARQGGLCAYCRADLTQCIKHLDHRMPLALGGSNWPDNLQWLCAPCNLAKGAQHPDLFEATMSEIATFKIGEQA